MEFSMLDVGGWKFLGSSSDSSTSPQNSVPSSSSSSRKQQPFMNLFLNTKSRLYNICRPLKKTLPEFSASPVYLLGIEYRANYQIRPSTPPPQQRQKSENSDKNTSPRQEREDREQLQLQPHHYPHVSAFLQDFASRIWFTYRNQFAPIHRTRYTTDLGWGCVLRTGQMLLAQAFLCHYLGRGWKRQQHDENDGAFMLYRQLLRWFADEPSQDAPYSIHAIARVGQEKFGKNIGQWFEPTTIANVLCHLVRRHKPDGLKIYIVKDGTLYKNEVIQLCQANETSSSSPSSSASCDKPSSAIRSSREQQEAVKDENNEIESEVEQKDDGPWSPLIIFVPVRLGVDAMNPLYIPALKSFFRLPQSLGCIGGKPHSSFYFMGYQDNNIIYMDPHVVHSAVDTNADDFSTETYHTTIPQMMPFTQIDPSLALGFYCSTRSDFDDFCSRAEQIGREEQCIVSILQTNAHTLVQNDISTAREDTMEDSLFSFEDDDDLVYL